MERLWKENGSRQEENARGSSASAEIVRKEFPLPKFFFKGGKIPIAEKEQVLLFSINQSGSVFQCS